MQGWLFLSFICMGSLFALTGLRQFFIEPLAGTGTNIVWFIIQILPIIAVLPGMLRMQINSFLYAILAASLYFIHGVMVAITEPLRWFGLIEVFFALAWMGVATYLLRRLRMQG